MRPGMSAKSHMKPDWNTPATGINTVSDHRKKFKINQYKKMLLVHANGKDVRDQNFIAFVICAISLSVSTHLAQS